MLKRNFSIYERYKIVVIDNDIVMKNNCFYTGSTIDV